MKIRSLAMIAALGTTAIIQPTQANAFGPTCVPRLQNCWCTYLVPCPVNDPGTRATTRELLRIEEERLEKLKESVKKLEQNTLALGGDISGLLAGLNSITIDIDGMVQSQVDQLTNMMQGFQEQIKDITVAAADIQKIIDGGLDATKIMDEIQKAGLDALDLQNLGVSPEAINGLLNGQLDPKKLLDVAGGLNFQGDVLKELGVTPEAITSIVNGEMPLSDLEKTLSASGLSLQDLADVGIDLSKLEDLAGSLDLKSGLDLINTVGINGLDIESSLTQFQGMIDGNIEASKIFDMANSIGLDIPNLKSLGVDESTIKAFLDGSFSAPQLLEIAKPLGLQGSALEGLGIDAEKIMGLAKGTVSPADFVKIAQDAGLSVDSLEKIGLPYSKIIDIAKNGDLTSAMSLVESSGLGSDALSALGLSASDVAGFAAGSVTQEKIQELLVNAGVDPSKIILPSIDGTARNALGEVVTKLDDTMHIPIASVPGLKDTIDNIRGLRGTVQSLSAQQILDDLSITAGIDLKSQEFMNKLIDGSASSSGLIQLMSQKGIGEEQLRKIGISRETIEAFKSGSFDASALVDFSQGLGIKGQALEGLGIGISSLKDVSKGALSPNQFLNKAKALGIDEETLKSSGLTTEALNKVASKGTVEAAEKLMSSADGAPAGGIPVPVAPGSPLSGLAASSSPFSSGSSGSVFSGGACGSQKQALLTNLDPPNYFGSDVAEIDAALSTGDILLHEEAIADAMRLSATNQAHILARSIALKNILKDAVENAKFYEAKIQNSADLDEDIRINDAVKMQLMTAQAEVASLYTYLASTLAARQINDGNFTEVPTAPNDAESAAAISKSAENRSAAAIEPATRGSAAAKAYTKADYQSSKAILGHDLLVHSDKLAAAAEDLKESIRHHEQLKSHLYLLEQRIRSVANGMYEDGDAAAKKLMDQLKSRAGSYEDRNRWATSNAIALSLDGAFSSKNNHYGKRIVIAPKERDMPEQLAQPAVQPYNYPTIDAQSADDPYYIVRPVLKSGRDEEPSPPPPLAGLLQYYMEAFRREFYYGEYRRGKAPETMSLMAWNEFKQFDTKCLTGPISSTLENIKARPELFDLSPSCTHLTWQDGDAEDYIPIYNFGGTDRSLWSNKIERNKIQLETGGKEAVKADAQDVLGSIRSENLIQELQDLNMQSWADHIIDAEEKLRSIIESDFANKVN